MKSLRPSNSEDTAESSGHVSSADDKTNASIQRDTIALFGANGKTGKHFLRQALVAGYQVRALVPNPPIQVSTTGSNKSNSTVSSSTSNETCTFQEFESQSAFKKVCGGLDDSKAVRRTLRGADYVVCLLTDTLPTKDYPKDCLAGFIRRLYPLMQREPNIKVFLYQVGISHGISLQCLEEEALISHRISNFVLIK